MILLKNKRKLKMNNFNDKFIVRKVKTEYIKNTKGKMASVKVATFGIKNEGSNKESEITIVLNPVPTGGIIGFGIYFGEKNKLIIYDSNGDIISVHNDMIFNPLEKGRIKKRF